jgi:hypothetical protein
MRLLRDPRVVFLNHPTKGTSSTLAMMALSLRQYAGAFKRSRAPFLGFQQVRAKSAASRGALKFTPAAVKPQQSLRLAAKDGQSAGDIGLLTGEILWLKNWQECRF